MAQPAARRVLIGSGLNSDTDARTLQLPHPSSGVAAAFVQLADGQLLELNWHKSAYTSWFVGDCVIEDGGMYAATPIDVLFILLPLLERHRQKTETHDGRFCSLEHLLEDEAYPSLAALAPLAAPALASVCVVQRSGPDEFYRLDDARALAWLAVKAERLLAVLMSGEGGGGGTFAALGESGVRSYAVELLGEYLPRAWLARLQAHLGCSPSGPGADGAPSRPSAEHAHFAEAGDAAAAAAKKPKLTKTEAQNASRAVSIATKNAKAAAGTKSLASFFGGKPKA